MFGARPLFSLRPLWGRAGEGARLGLLAAGILLTIAGCGKGADPGSGGGGGLSFLPQSDNVWAVVVDVTPSVELSNEANVAKNADSGMNPGEFVAHELDQARNLRDDGFKNDYFLISGSAKPEMHVEKLPKSVGEIPEQDKPLSDYAACLTEVIDRYPNLKKGQKMRLSIFGDFRHASSGQNYRNWSPSADKFGGKRIDGWEVELVCPNYPSGSDSGAEQRASLWAKCLKDMGAASVSVSTEPSLKGR